MKPDVAALLVLWLVLGQAIATHAGDAQPAQPAESPPPAEWRFELEKHAPRFLKPDDRFAVNGAFMGAVQWIARSDTAAGSVFGNGSLQLTVTARPTERLRLFAEGLGVLGPGPDARLGTLTRLNERAEDLEGREHTARLMKFVVESSWFDDHVRVIVGKLDPTDYFDRNAFAEDEQDQFLDGALVHNGVLKHPTNGPGAVVRVAVGDWRYALGVHGLDNVGGDLSGVPFIIAEVGRRNVFARAGTYRLWARVASVLEDRDRLTWGTGISVDQFITPAVGVFVRAGVARTEGRRSTAHAWSSGLQVTPTALGRGADAIGLGFAEQREPEGRERLAEVYYRLQVFDQLALFAGVQWLISGPNTVTGGRNRDIVIPGFRAVVGF